MKSLAYGLDHEAEFLGPLALISIGFGLSPGLEISRPMTRPRTCKNVSFRIRKD